ncbi:DUF4760 domain-containing protein [Klebsiella variicola]|nr:DUF4760 domain-containing protein [Klebsiella variicola]MCI4402839.1 DUF4760 domain-containing protein [Klebsiella variicola]HDU1491114.1 DUF4760 domain-containing protein [Klebsiella pneumoniae]
MEYRISNTNFIKIYDIAELLIKALREHIKSRTIYEGFEW